MPIFYRLPKVSDYSDYIKEISKKIGQVQQVKKWVREMRTH